MTFPSSIHSDIHHRAGSGSAYPEREALPAPGGCHRKCHRLGLLFPSSLSSQERRKKMHTFQMTRVQWKHTHKELGEGGGAVLGAGRGGGWHAWAEVSSPRWAAQGLTGRGSVAGRSSMGTQASWGDRECKGQETNTSMVCSKLYLPILFKSQSTPSSSSSSLVRGC